jgi:agmatinase
MSTPTLLGVPYDAASSFMRGSAAGPAKIREALHSPAGNPWSETLIDTSAPDVIQDAGDVEFLLGGDALLAIEKGVERVLSIPGRPIALGGDHSVTFPIIRALRRQHHRLTILHVDAHTDLYDEFDGDRFSHACPFARIMEAGLADRLVQVGIRTMTGHTQSQAERFGVDVIDMRAWCEGKRPFVEGPVYVSIDLDGIDPAFAPGVSHPEPGGLSARDVIGMVQQLAPPIVGADIVELNPSVDPNDLTARVAAKLVKELVARMHVDK